MGTDSKVDVEDVAVEKVQQFEPDPVNLTAGIQIKNLKKEFKSNRVTKVCSLYQEYSYSNKKLNFFLFWHVWMRLFEYISVLSVS